jgi:hypothetical protein
MTNVYVVPYYKRCPYSWCMHHKCEFRGLRSATHTDKLALHKPYFDGVGAEMLLIRFLYHCVIGSESWGLPKVVSSFTKFILYGSARLHAMM